MKSSEERKKHYWDTNLKYLAVLLGVWFFVSYGCGVLFVDDLDNVRMGGFKLGFWFAQQGSIYVFVVLIVVYVALMNRLDRIYDLDERRAREKQAGGGNAAGEEASS